MVDIVIGLSLIITGEWDRFISDINNLFILVGIQGAVIIVYTIKYYRAGAFEKSKNIKDLPTWEIKEHIKFLKNKALHYESMSNKEKEEINKIIYEYKAELARRNKLFK